MDKEKLSELIRIAEENNLEEIEVSGLWSRFRIRRATGSSRTLAESPPVQREPAAASTESLEESKGLVSINSPIVGTFYRAPSPDGEPYVDVNEDVEVGQVVCVVEAMKLMNEVQSNVAGRVVSVPVVNSEPVEYGEPLFWVDPREKETASKK